MSTQEDSEWKDAAEELPRPKAKGWLRFDTGTVIGEFRAPVIWERPQVKCREAVPWGQGFCSVSITQSRCLAHGHSFIRRQWVKGRKVWRETFICTHGDASHPAFLPPPLGRSCRAGSSLIPTPPHPQWAHRLPRCSRKVGQPTAWRLVSTCGLIPRLCLFFNFYCHIIDVQCCVTFSHAAESVTHTHTSPPFVCFGHVACGILVPWPGIKPVLPAVESQES